MKFGSPGLDPFKVGVSVTSKITPYEIDQHPAVGINRILKSERLSGFLIDGRKIWCNTADLQPFVRWSHNVCLRLDLLNSPKVGIKQVDWLRGGKR